MSEDKTKSMPYNLEAEQSVLGSMLIDNEIAPEALSVLNGSDFYIESHKYILYAIQEVYQARKPIDLITVTDKLESASTLEKIGGIAYVTELAQITPSAANYKYYLEIVKRDSLNRKLIHAADEIKEYARTSEDKAQSIRYAEDKLYGLSKTQDSSAVEDIRDSTLIYDTLTKFSNIEKDKDALKGLMTGFFRLDRITNGLQKSNLIVIAARPGMGKTSLAMNIVEHAAVYDGKVCAVFSLEMSKEEIMQRLICSVSGVSMSLALSGKMNIEDWKRMTKASQSLQRSALIIDDSANVTPAEILSKCRRIQAKNGRLDLVMIDYIQLMTSGHRNDENRTLEVASISRYLKIMAKDLNVPVIALSQLRRTKEEPTLSDLRESGAIEQDADIVMFVNRPDVGVSDEDLINKHIVKGAAVLNIAKHRNGELARLPLRFKGEITKFVDAEKEG